MVQQITLVELGRAVQILHNPMAAIEAARKDPTGHALALLPEAQAIAAQIQKDIEKATIPPPLEEPTDPTGFEDEWDDETPFAIAGGLEAVEGADGKTRGFLTLYRIAGEVGNCNAGICQ